MRFHEILNANGKKSHNRSKNDWGEAFNAMQYVLSLTHQHSFLRYHCYRLNKTNWESALFNTTKSKSNYLALAMFFVFNFSSLYCSSCIFFSLLCLPLLFVSLSVSWSFAQQHLTHHRLRKGKNGTPTDQTNHRTENPKELILICVIYVCIRLHDFLVDLYRPSMIRFSLLFLLPFHKFT